MVRESSVANLDDTLERAEGNQGWNFDFAPKKVQSVVFWKSLSKMSWNTT